MGDWPLAAACWLTSAMKPAHSGVARLVPSSVQSDDAPMTSLPHTIFMLLATRETSGMFRIVAEPWLAVMLMPCCHVGIAYVRLTPPPEAAAGVMSPMPSFD